MNSRGNASLGEYLGSVEQAQTDLRKNRFGVLERAQALGDRQALREAGRRLVRFHLAKDVVSGIERLLEGAS